MRTQLIPVSRLLSRPIGRWACVLSLPALGLLAGGCQQEMRREDKGYSLPSFKGVSDSGMRATSPAPASSSASRSDSSQNKPSSSGRSSGSDQNKPASRSRGMV